MGRRTIESSQQLELTWLKSHGFLEGGFKSGHVQWSRGSEPTGNINIQIDTTTTAPYIRFTYRSRDWVEKLDDNWVDRDYQFPLVRLPCHYGGFKWFVRCQLSKNGTFCGRRVRVLYSVGGYYGCRHCAELTYESCNQSGRYKGFLSIPDLKEQEEKVKRMYYAGKPTKKYRRLQKLEQQFNESFIRSARWLVNRYKK